MKQSSKTRLSALFWIGLVLVTVGIGTELLPILLAILNVPKTRLGSSTVFDSLSLWEMISLLLGIPLIIGGFLVSYFRGGSVGKMLSLAMPPAILFAFVRTYNKPHGLGSSINTGFGTSPTSLIGVIALCIGVFLSASAYSALRKLDKYEFENRTSGGVVEFSSYEAAQSHSRKKNLWSLVIVAAVLAILFGILCFLLPL